jgi:hypothetical protein
MASGRKRHEAQSQVASHTIHGARDPVRDPRFNSGDGRHDRRAIAYGNIGDGKGAFLPSPGGGSDERGSRLGRCAAPSPSRGRRSHMKNGDHITGPSQVGLRTAETQHLAPGAAVGFTLEEPPPRPSPASGRGSAQHPMRVMRTISNALESLLLITSVTTGVACPLSRLQGRQPARCSPHHAGKKVGALLRPLIPKDFRPHFLGRAGAGALCDVCMR